MTNKSDYHGYNFSPFLNFCYFIKQKSLKFAAIGTKMYVVF